MNWAVSAVSIALYSGEANAFSFSRLRSLLCVSRGSWLRLSAHCVSIYSFASESAPSRMSAAGERREAGVRQLSLARLTAQA